MLTLFCFFIAACLSLLILFCHCMVTIFHHHFRIFYFSLLHLLFLLLHLFLLVFIIIIIIVIIIIIITTILKQIVFDVIFISKVFCLVLNNIFLFITSEIVHHRSN